MKRLIISILFILLMTGNGWSTTYYLSASGDNSDNTAGCSTAMDMSDFNAASFSGNDIINVCDDDGVFRSTMTIPSSGTSGSPITIQKMSGDSPVISGADLVTTWTNTGNELDDNFDDNDITDWTVAAGTIVAGSQVVTATLAAGAGDWAYQAVTARTEYFVSFKFTMSALSWGDSTYIIGPGAANSATGYFNLSLEGTHFYLYYTDDTTNQLVDTGDTFSTGTEYDVLMHWKKSSGVGADDGIVRVWINGTLAYSKTDVDNDAVNNLDLALIGNYTMDGSTGTGTMVIDDYKIGQTAARENLWHASATNERFGLLMDTTWGTKKDSLGEVFSANEWFWLGNYAYVYSTSDPDNLSSPGVQVSSRASCIDFNNQNYITIDGIELQAANNQNILVDGTSDNSIIENVTSRYAGQYGFASGGGSNLLLKDSEIYSNGQVGVFGYKGGGASSGNENVIQNCSIYNNGQFGIVIQDNFFIVEENVVYDNGVITELCSGIEIYNGDDDGFGEDNIIRYNRVYGQISGSNDGEGIYADEESLRTSIYGNVIYDNDGPCIGVYDANYAKVYNNSCYANCQNSSGELVTFTEIKVIATIAGDTTYTEIKNNAVYATSADTYAIYVDDEVEGSTGLDITNNTLYSDDPNWYYWKDGEGGNLATWNALTGVGTDLNSDPLFTNAAGSNFTLQPGSPAIDAGADLGATYDDALDPASTWPDGVLTLDQDDYGDWEIGAYVFKTGGSSLVPGINFSPFGFPYSPIGPD